MRQSKKIKRCSWIVPRSVQESLPLCVPVPESKQYSWDESCHKKGCQIFVEENVICVGSEWRHLHLMTCHVCLKGKMRIKLMVVFYIMTFGLFYIRLAVSKNWVKRKSPYTCKDSLLIRFVQFPCFLSFPDRLGLESIIFSNLKNVRYRSWFCRRLGIEFWVFQTVFRSRNLEVLFA